MRRIVAHALGLLSLLAVGLTCGALWAMPGSLREFGGEPDEAAFILGGTALLALLALLWGRGAWHGYGRAAARSRLDVGAVVVLVVLGCLATLFGVHGELKLGSGYMLGALFLASALCYLLLVRAARREDEPPEVK